ncbi:TPA: ParA family protein, partial [Klebsiella pneumoniae]
MLTRVVFNQKGGVGKSSITVNLAAISAKHGLRTLVIDLDPQANSSQYLLGE